MAIGGWPTNLGSNVAAAQRLLRGYLSEIARADISRVDDRRRDPRLAERLIRSLGRNVATAASIAHLGRDVNGADGHHKPETISAYLDAMSRLMIVEDLAAWAPSLRS
jgi:predicted AAA+ superfamily ATPase